MAKWADHAIFRVRFNTANTHIDQVEVADDTGDGFGPKRAETRATVIAKLKARETYVTALRSLSNPGNVDQGARVEIVVVNGAEYLRTDANRTARDNLDNLPQF